MRPFSLLRASRVLATGLVLAAGCAKSTVVDTFAAPDVSPLVASLSTASSCDDLLARLRADARTKAEAEAYRMVETYDEGGYGGGAIWYSAGGAERPTPGVPTSTDTPGMAPSGGAQGPSTYTETNTQVPGVDEADFVENDGTHLYLLHDRSFYVFATYPATSLAIASTTAIEGEPRAMFVANGRAAIFSEIWTPIDTTTDGGTTGPVPLPGGYDLPYYGYGATSTKITVLDLSAATPIVVSERYLEGAYVDGRRHSDAVRLLVRGDTVSPYALVSMPSAWDSSGRLRSRSAYVSDVSAWLAAVHERIASTTLDDFLPSESVVVSGTKQAVAFRCGDYHLPRAGQTDAGLVTVLGFSLASPSDVDAEVIVGRADVVYANADALYLAQNDWRWERFSGIASQESVLHRFDLSGIATRYVASGKVVGTLKDQFSIDATGEVLRLATSEDRPTTPVASGTAGVSFVPTQPVSHVVTLIRQGSALAPLGSGPDLAPGERLQAVRFLGDFAYVVTFRQVDPLFVVDLSRPEAPTLRGEVTIPGFSTYVHPLDAGHLLTIGRDIDPATNQDLGLALQIFDVTDPAHPTRTHVLTRPGWSGAAWDHKAFVYEPARGLLAIPVDSYDTTFESSLRLFTVSLATGIAELGGVVHTGFFSGCVGPSGPALYDCSYPATVRRGLFVDANIFTVSYGGVTAHAVAALATPLASVPLPQPEFTWEGPYFLGATTSGGTTTGVAVP